jgi:hypothetical protein
MVKSAYRLEAQPLQNRTQQSYASCLHRCSTLAYAGDCEFNYNFAASRP